MKKWLSESKNKIKLSYDEARKKKFILERMKRQTEIKRTVRHIYYCIFIITIA
jgi:hypothetical protein